MGLCLQAPLPVLSLREGRISLHSSFLYRSLGTALVLVTTLLTITLGGCTGAGEGHTTQELDERAATNVVIDDIGRELSPKPPPRRIISLIPSTTEVLTALGAGDRIVARTDFDDDPELADLPSVGPGLTPSLEWLTTQRPDLVISWADARDRGLAARLEELGITVYSARIEGIDDVLSTIDRLGTLLDLRTGADSLTRTIRNELDEVRASVEGRERPVVLYLIGDDPPMTVGSGTFLDELITIAGGTNLFHDLKGWPQVNLEEILRRQPDLLIVPIGEGNAPIERLARRPGWRELEAVRTNSIYTIDATTAHRPGPRLTETARRLASIIHPEASP